MALDLDRGGVQVGVFEMERVELRPQMLEVAFARVGRRLCCRLLACPGLSRCQVAGL